MRISDWSSDVCSSDLPVDPRYWNALLGDEIARDKRDEEEAEQLLDILEDQVVPLYYGFDDAGYAPEWIRISKNSMKTLIPRFNAERMVMDYVRKFYGPAARQEIGRAHV